VAYVDVKNQFIALLNRRDITPSLVNTFMGFGLQRIQREVRIPSMEKVATLLTDGGPQLAVPGDLLEFISVHTNDETNNDRLIRTDLQTILRLSKTAGIPKFYHREGAYLYIGPCPVEGTAVFVSYYSDATALSADTDTNWVTEIAPVLLIYGALSYAADYYLDDRKALFEQTYTNMKQSLTDMAQQDELENASITPAFVT
jgi:hypothetical protein